SRSPFLALEILRYSIVFIRYWLRLTASSFDIYFLSFITTPPYVSIPYSTAPLWYFWIWV
ncbi:MAG: hypothetical protein ABJC12_07875, partial [Saprospiraceae bacterium]